MLHVRVQGNKLGVFDFFSMPPQANKWRRDNPRPPVNGNIYYDVWTSFSTEKRDASPVAGGQPPEALPVETEGHEDRILERRYVIDAHVKPPKQVDATVELQFDVVRGGWRFLAFELSRFLQVQSVEADGKPVEFIHNPVGRGYAVSEKRQRYVGCDSARTSAQRAERLACVSSMAER